MKLTLLPTLLVTGLLLGQVQNIHAGKTHRHESDGSEDFALATREPKQKNTPKKATPTNQTARYKEASGNWKENLTPVRDLQALKTSTAKQETPKNKTRKKKHKKQKVAEVNLKLTKQYALNKETPAYGVTLNDLMKEYQEATTQLEACLAASSAIYPVAVKATTQPKAEVKPGKKKKKQSNKKKYQAVATRQKQVTPQTNIATTTKTVVAEKTTAQEPAPQKQAESSASTQGFTIESLEAYLKASEQDSAKVTFVQPPLTRTTSSLTPATKVIAPALAAAVQTATQKSKKVKKKYQAVKARTIKSTTQTSNESIEFTRKTIINSQGVIKQTLFSPNGNIKQTLVGLINAEKGYIRLAIFCLTDSDIAQALIAAYKRGVRVEVITDGSYQKQPLSTSAIPQLCRAGIPVCIVTKAKGFMHNKFIVFSKNIDNKAVLWTGSFNFTAQANGINKENVLITEDTDFVHSYIKQFHALKEENAVVAETQAQQTVAHA